MGGTSILLVLTCGLWAVTAGLPRRPNILFMMVDELQFPPVYQNAELRAWQLANLPAQDEMRRTGFEALQARTASSACAPSRTTIFTGQYPSLHGVSQTDGAAKSNSDPDQFWLDPNTVPTMGAYFEEAGYQTEFRGKWHLSRADIIIPGTQSSLASYDKYGFPQANTTEWYVASDRLKTYGWHGWRGPEPHGSSPRNSGGSAAKIDGIGLDGRDVVYASEVIDQLRNFHAGSQACAHGSPACNDRPWFLVCDLVNPHDVTLWGELSRRIPTFNFSIDSDVPQIPPAPTAHEDLSTKPKCQQSYKQQYQKGFQPTIDDMDYRRLYQTLIRKADRNLKKVLDALKLYGFDDNSIVVLTADHGDHLGAHGLFQKWYTAYEEAIHVPLFIRLPPLLIPPSQQAGKKITQLTSSVDLLPTLLSLADIDQRKIQRALKRTHDEVHPLPGRDLTPLLFGHNVPETPILFMTNDDVLLGPNMVSLLGVPYTAVLQPNHVQSVLTRIDGVLWKFNRYWDSPQFWSNPGVEDQIVLSTCSVDSTPSAFQLSAAPPCAQNVSATTQLILSRSLPVPDEFEMYNLTEDPIEVNNLAGKPRYRHIEAQLAKLLTEQVKTKLLQPSSGTVPGQNGVIANYIPEILPRPS